MRARYARKDLFPTPHALACAFDRVGHPIRRRGNAWSLADLTTRQRVRAFQRRHNLADHGRVCRSTIGALLFIHLQVPGGVECLL